MLKMKKRKHWKAILLASAVSFATCIPAQAEKSKIKMLFWTFQPQKVQEFADEFMKRNPNIEVELEGVPAPEYNAKASLMFRSKTPFDVLYIRDTVLPQWVENGWVAPIDDCPGVDEAKKNIIPVALQAQSHDGNLYGLTYYTGIYPIIANKRMLAEAGIDAPPKSFDGWLDAARKMKAKGIVEYPMVFPIRSYGWGATYIWGAMAAAKGGKVFDDEFKITPEGLETLAWWRSTFEEGLTDPANIEWTNADATSVFSEGKAAMLWSMHIYAGNAFANNAEKSKVRGEAILVQPPESGTLVGQAAMYGINAGTADKDAACKLVTFLGTKDENGMYATPKAWVEAAALAWGERGIEKDPDIRASIESWGGDPDQLAGFLDQAVHLKNVLPYGQLWYSEWQEYADKQLQEILAGKVSIEDGTSKMTERAVALNKRYAKK